MDSITWLTIACIVVAVLSWVAHFMGWIGGTRRGDVPDPSATMQGSTWTPPPSDPGAGHHG
ncbi:hypothetical protein ACLBWP_11060 [Microbacterium sp. M1A1_1b]|uniref:hypothetical protein n=1 Tax=Curtobacterium sp. VKM Ac-2922 TaxID=2929475 RepID=UPI001FB32BF6|nr:hypothetical protein [Curtobacterium sp. VKM Ac-2922]MCJ1715241.1 hypothetical protein [Curtobacterium sp. VKM Ac-2922]